MKEKETKLTKDTSGKIQLSPGRAIQLRINNTQGALKMKCQEDHEEITGYNAELDK